MLSEITRNSILRIQDKHKPIMWTYFCVRENDVDVEYFTVNSQHRQDMYLEFRINYDKDRMCHIIHCNKFLSQRKIAGIEAGVRFEDEVIKTVVEFIYFGIGGIQ